MKYTYQYKAIPTTDQKLELNHWLRICQYWYNRQLARTARSLTPTRREVLR
ncbi:helix-turn-helix domain-containing protein [Aulosira sp. FACHB-615]|uniref:helix-turn-helix domain-containing protein n=1 Tax=Aulosira sp. FACHB-615 TaxID=2692777 RepID=UPI0018EF766E